MCMLNMIDMIDRASHLMLLSSLRTALRKDDPAIREQLLSGLGRHSRL